MREGKKEERQRQTERQGQPAGPKERREDGQILLPARAGERAVEDREGHRSAAALG